MADGPDTSGGNRDSLGRFPKGVSGNPAGRPKGSLSLATMLKHLLEEVPEGGQRSYAETLVKETLIAAIHGDARARRLVWEYVEGRPVERVAIMENIADKSLDELYPDDEEARAHIDALIERLGEGLSSGPSESSE